MPERFKKEGHQPRIKRRLRTVTPAQLLAADELIGFIDPHGFRPDGLGDELQEKISGQKRKELSGGRN